MNPRNLLALLALVVLALMLWELRWVLLVLFGGGSASKGVQRDYVRGIGTALIVAPFPALAGAVAALRG
mgnify:CR=1 FL=1